MRIAGAYQMANKTILKWAGSKVRIMEQLRPHLPKTKRLIEPFGGSMAIFMNTDYDEYIIGDINYTLINMYRVARSDPDGLIHATRQVFSSSYQNSDNKLDERDRYYLLRSRFNQQGLNPLYQAAYFIYLNRHCFRGLCRYNHDGGFNVPYGDYKQPYFPEQEIQAFVTKARNKAIRFGNVISDLKVHFECKDWFELLNEINTQDGIYCDPPYMGTKDSFSTYWKSGFTERDHENLAHTLRSRASVFDCQVTVSNSIEAKELYADLGFTVHEIEAPRTISVDGNRKPAKEIIAVLNGANCG